MKKIVEKFEKYRLVNPMKSHVKLYEINVICPGNGENFLAYVPAAASTNVLNYLDRIVSYAFEHKDIGFSCSKQEY